MKYLFFVGLYATGVAIRTTYEILKKNGSTRAQLPRNADIAARSTIIGAVPVRLPPSQLLWWLGLGISTASVGLDVAGLAQLKGVENLDHLVTTGPFVSRRLEERALESRYGEDFRRYRELSWF